MSSVFCLEHFNLEHLPMNIYNFKNYIDIIGFITSINRAEKCKIIHTACTLTKRYMIAKYTETKRNSGTILLIYIDIV